MRSDIWLASPTQAALFPEKDHEDAPLSRTGSYLQLLCQALYKSGYSEAQMTQQQPWGRIVEAKMVAIKTCSVQTNPDWCDLCRFAHFSVYGLFVLVFSITGAYRTFTDLVQ